MALIECSECKKEVSDKAKNCPHCGFPIEEHKKLNIVESLDIESAKLDNIEVPKFPNNLDIGIKRDLKSYGFYMEGRLENKIHNLISIGNVKIILYSKGVRITNIVNQYDIHNSQIINLKIATHEEIKKVKKSIIGRGLFGGLILGPAGLILGGMTGLKDSEKTIKKNYLIINYWNVSTKEIQTILISGLESDINTVINLQNEENIIKVSTAGAWIIFILFLLFLGVSAQLFKG